MRQLILLQAFFCLLMIGPHAAFQAQCQTTAEAIEREVAVMPASDPQNLGGWVLNEALSDEFEGTELDPEKWFVEGQDGDYYIWKGRAPAQFAPHNVIVEDGKLKLRTQWEPDYPFDQEGYKESGAEAYGVFEEMPLPITTAGVITKKRFLYGYMEVKSKVGDAAITGAFWAIGYEQELDIYEQMGHPKIKGGIQENTVRTAVHDWSPPAVRPTRAFGFDEQNLPYRTADEFHIYGAEWGPDFLKVFRDGVLIAEFYQDELGIDWVLNNPMEIWLDSEAFSWLGVPHKEELPADFEIEYLRVWQKPSPNLLAPAFYGFEGPILFEENPRPLDLLPESSIPDDYQKFWLFDSTSAKYLSIVKGDYATGVNSLKFSGYGKNEHLDAEQVSVVTPEGAVNLPAGEYVFSCKIWMDQGRAVEKLHVSFESPEQELVLDLSDLDRREWVLVEIPFTKTEDSSSTDQMTLEIRKEDAPETKGAKFFLDDISIRNVKQ
ncbi:family 16 glycosylhydrolase [Pontibacter sp. G13]|uniref:family 16 glycosylhydrolase n=1 Tax=Pontibacter sp. G13 TaxID=3074898 RepID=UPI0028893A04|nr:family 16 glycosylhydrolase [Pontibacter sp. G13]WNJ20570.1 family 16 glycosylhydrolase [Pontibacter sp. G13]